MFFGQIATAEQRVQKSAVSIMNHEKWRDLGSVIMVGDRRVTTHRQAILMVGT